MGKSTGTAGKKILVVGYRINAGGPVAVSFFKSSVAGAISAGEPLVAEGGILAPLRRTEYFHSEAGEDLVINLSANANVGVEVDFVVR